MTQQVGLVKVAVEVELDLGGRRVWAAGREARQRVFEVERRKGTGGG